MELKEHDKIIAFDTLFTNNRIQMLKIIMPYFDASMQKNFAVYIKFMELQYTIAFFQSNPVLPFPHDSEFEFDRMFKDMIPYCSPTDRSRMEQYTNMFSMMKNYKDMMETVSMMKDMFPEGEGGFNPEMLSGILGNDAAQMFDMFSFMNQTQEGGTSNEQQTGMDE